MPPEVTNSSLKVVLPFTSNSWAHKFFINLFWAAEPTLDTDKPGDTAGLIPLENKSVSKKIWPSW